LYPGPEVSKWYFPYIGHADFMAPIIAIKLTNPTPNVVIGITCRVWAKNIGTRVEYDATLNRTQTIHSTSHLPAAELPLNILIE